MRSLVRTDFEIEYDGFPCFRYSRLPDVIPDMIYLDGSTFTGQRKIAVDVLDLEEKLQTGFTLIIDGRKRKAEFLKTHFRRPFEFRHRIWHYNTVVTLNS